MFVHSYTDKIARKKIVKIEIVITQQFIYLLSSIFHFFFICYLNYWKTHFLLLDIYCMFLFILCGFSNDVIMLSSIISNENKVCWTWTFSWYNKLYTFVCSYCFLEFSSKYGGLMVFFCNIRVFISNYKCRAYKYNFCFPYSMLFVYDNQYEKCMWTLMKY